MVAARRRGVIIRRTRIVSEPVSEYIRWEHEITSANAEAGEDVRWLPPRRASDLLLPGNDFWVPYLLVRLPIDAGPVRLG